MDAFNPADVIGEVIQVSQDQFGGRTEWHSINLRKSYRDPVVVAHTLSVNGSDPCHVRVKNVQSEQFQWQIEEWTYLNDGYHIEEIVPFLVMEKGVHRLQDETLVEAGQKNMNHNWIRVNFDAPFSSTPVVLTGLSSLNGPAPAVVRMKELSERGFWMRLQEEEGQDDLQATEPVSWVAMTRAEGTNHDQKFKISRSHAVEDELFTVSFELPGLTNPPVFMGNVETISGTDAVGLRFINVFYNRATIRLDEERSVDQEVNQRPSGHVPTQDRRLWA